MSKSKRLQRIWKFLCWFSHPYFEHKFRFHHEKYILPGPSLIISNHVTNWDPMLLAISFPRNHIHFVASEHIFRWGKLSKIINWLVAPIARRKGASGSQTAMECMRLLRDGHSIGIFGEGEVTWDGRSQEITPGTGALAKASGSFLITHRFEGGSLSLPRWAKHVRKGRMTGKIVNIYSPEQLKTMSTDEIAEAINRDIYMDAYAIQRENPTLYRGKCLAEHIESALFLCPKCHRINTLQSKGDHITCACGLNIRYTEYGLFSPEAPFENIQQWDAWQHEQLQFGAFQHDETLFSDEDIIWQEIKEDQKALTDRIQLSIDQKGEFFCGDQSVSLGRITHMAIVQTNKLFFTVGSQYFQLKAEKRTVNFRKYLAAWKIYHSERKDENGLFRR